MSVLLGSLQASERRKVMELFAEGIKKPLHVADRTVPLAAAHSSVKSENKPNPISNTQNRCCLF